MAESPVLILLGREFRSAVRERSIVVNSILIPVFLYPLLLWGLFTALTVVDGLAERARSRVAVHGVPEAHQELLDSLRALPAIELVESTTVEDAERRLQAGELDLVADLEAAGASSPGLAENFRVRLLYDRSLERSRRARARAAGVIERYRKRWLSRRVEELAIPRAEVVGFRIDPHSVSTGRQLGTLVLSEVLPLFIVVMVALGCFIPAIDTTAGERERSTWETTLILAVSRRDVVVAKYLYVAALGFVAGALNVIAMFVTMAPVVAPIVAQTGEDFAFSLPALAFPVMVLGTFVLALFFAAAMMILAAFARTFKEGQGMVTPVFWLALVPLLFGQGSESTLTPATAAIPVANVAMMLRDAVRGVYQWPLIAETLAVTLGIVVLCLLVARTMLRFEDFLIGAYDGSFWRFLRERTFGRGAASRRRVGRALT